MDEKRNTVIKRLEEVISQKEKDLKYVKSQLQDLMLEKEYDEVISKFNDTYWKYKCSYYYIKKIEMNTIENVAYVYFSGIVLSYLEDENMFNYKCWQSEEYEPLEVHKMCLMNEFEKITKEEFEHAFDIVRKKLASFYKP